MMRMQMAGDFKGVGIAPGRPRVVLGEQELQMKAPGVGGSAAKAAILRGMGKRRKALWESVMATSSKRSASTWAYTGDRHCRR